MLPLVAVSALIPLIIARGLPSGFPDNSTLSGNGTDIDLVDGNGTVLLPPKGDNQSVNPLLTANLDVAEEMRYIREQFHVMTHNVNEWMHRPSNQMRVLPAIIGCLSALVTLIAFFILRCMCTRCQSFARRRKIGGLTKDLSSRKKLMSDLDLDE